jgi:hypothetical protein
MKEHGMSKEQRDGWQGFMECGLGMMEDEAGDSTSGIFSWRGGGKKLLCVWY